MSEFLPKTGPVAAVFSATERRNPVRVPAAAGASPNSTDAEVQPPASVIERSSGVADYAKLKADIADVVARIEPASGAGIEPVERAERALMALMPQPVIMLPLPPADPAMVAFVAQIAQTMATQAAQARAAQANATPVVVEAAAN